MWAARQWIRIADVDTDVLAARRLGVAFRHVGAPQGLASLDAVLGLLATSARRPLDFRQTADVAIGRDERGLIEVIDSLQAQPADRQLCACAGAACEIVTDWVGHARLPLLQAQLAELAMELGAAGLRVSCAERDGAGSSREVTHGAARA